MHSDAHVERVLPARLGDIFVCANTSSFQGFRGELLILIGDEMTAEWEFVDRCPFTPEIEDTNLEAGQQVYLTEPGDDAPWGLEHLCYTSTWGRACSCSNGNI